VTELAGGRGYAHLTVESVLETAAASRATFYQHFSNIEDCFQYSYRVHAEQFVEEVGARVRGARHTQFTIQEALVDLALQRPAVARLLMVESLAAGASGLRERDVLISALERTTRGFADEGARIDMPAPLLLGGVFRHLSMRLIAGRPLTTTLRADLREWASIFAVSRTRGSRAELLAVSLLQRDLAPSAPSSGVRADQSPRERVLRAIAASVTAKGYRGMTVADVARVAGVSRRTFYNEFRDKEQAFSAAFDDAFRRTVAACTPAFFELGPWPERVWRASLEFTGFLAREPLFAYLGFVESYALGPDFAARVHECCLAFTVFLEDGYLQRPRAGLRSRGCASLAAATIFEAAYHASRNGPGVYLRRLQPLAVYIALAPFIGADDALCFVTAKHIGACAPSAA
jgi:AcrR family transcriptional regulator